MTSLNTSLIAGAKLTAAAAILALPLASHGWAQSAVEAPAQTTATYSDWTVRCRQDDTANVQRCEMVQVLSTADRQSTVANLAIGSLPGEEEIRFVLQLPLGVHLPTDVAFMIDEENVTTARFETCFPTFCMAYATLDTSAVDQMKAGATMTMAFKDRAQRDVSMPISLNGFTAAYNATFNAGS